MKGGKQLLTKEDAHRMPSFEEALIGFLLLWRRPTSLLRSHRKEGAELLYPVAARGCGGGASEWSFPVPDYRPENQ